MQCFGGCFAAQREPAANYGKSAVLEGDVTAGNGKWALPATGKGQVSCADISVDCRAASAPAPSTSSKSLLRLLSSKSNKKLEGPTYTPTEDTSDYERDQLRQQYTMQHGRHILGVSTLQQEQLHHFVMPGIGYIAYTWMDCTSAIEPKVATALSDPVCDPQHYRTMAEAFLREHPNGIFVQVSFEFASVLQQLGFTCNSMGGDTRLDIASYNFTGYARRGLRSAISAAVKDGIKVEEVMHPGPDTLGTAAAKGAGAAAAAAVGTDWTQLAEEMLSVDAKWAANRPGRAHEVWFINRPPVFRPEAGVRKFVARNAAGELQGYIFFDGVFEGGQLIGYYANVTRLLPDAHPGTLNLIIKDFLDRVRAEAQLSAPKKQLSMRRSQRKKLEAAAAAPAGDIADVTPGLDQAKLRNQQQQQQQQQQKDEATASAGPKFLSLGLSPFYQMNNKPVKGWKSCYLTHLLLLLSYEDGAGFYPFKPLAAAKARYGAGLHNFKYEDPNVQYCNAFLCHRYKNPYTTFWRMFDLAKLYGFWSGVGDCFGRYFEFKGKQGAEFMARTLKKAASLDTYKPNNNKKKCCRRSKSAGSFSSSVSSVSSGTARGSSGSSGTTRSKSAPAAVCGLKQCGSGKKAQQGLVAAAGATAGVGAGAGAAVAGLSGRTVSHTSSQIATAAQPPVPSDRTSDRTSDAASSQSPTHSSGSNAIINSSDSA